MERLIRHTNAYKTQRLYASQGKLRHAYFLLFPDSGSLREVLKIFATLFFERNAKTETDRARVESLIKKESYADCIFYPEAGKKFSVADAEAVEEECILRPVEGETKLFVIGDFSEATKEAQNKMLKMLEEPPEGVSFLLGATSSFSVLPTVLSRVEKIEFPSFSESEITAYLLRNVPSLSERDAALCAKSSGGIPGKALELASGGYFKELTQAAWNLCFSTPASLPYLVREYGATKYPKELLSLLKIIYFDALKLKIAKERNFTFPGSVSDNENVIKLAGQYPKGELLKALNVLSDGERQLYFNGSFAQILEISLSKILAGNRG